MYVYARACMSVHSLYIQDPPNGALECEVDGVATTTVVTITAPVLMTDERGVMSLTYVRRRTRQGDARRSNDRKYDCSCRGGV